jgi:hypothetical protein
MIKNNITLIIISMLIFSVLNILENIVHYNIGRSFKQKFTLNMPSIKDFQQIIIVMLIFAFLQGILTDLFMNDF